MKKQKDNLDGKDDESTYELTSKKDIQSEIKRALEDYDKTIKEKFKEALESQSSYWIEFLKEDMKEFERTQKTNLITIIRLLKRIRVKEKDFEDQTKILGRDVRRLKGKEFMVAVKNHRFFNWLYKKRRKIGVTKAQKKLDDKQKVIEGRQNNLERDIENLKSTLYTVLNELMNDNEAGNKLKKNMKRDR